MSATKINGFEDGIRFSDFEGAIPEGIDAAGAIDSDGARAGIARDEDHAGSIQHDAGDDRIGEHKGFHASDDIDRAIGIEISQGIGKGDIAASIGREGTDNRG